MVKRSVGDVMKLTESHNGETLDLDANNYARIIRTYRNVSRIKKIYWIAGGGAAVIVWYLGHIPWWAIPIGALLLMLLNWTLSSMTLAWLSRATGLPTHVVYGIYLGRLRENVEETRDQIEKTRHQEATAATTVAKDLKRVVAFLCSHR